MLRTRLLALALPCLVALLLLAPAARADRMGGAYRGAYDYAMPEWGPPGQDPTGRVVEDHEAYWTFWFEHNKEWILTEKLGKRLARARMPEEQRKKLVLPLLVDSLSSRNEWVREAAVIALGKLGDEAVVPHLARRAEDRDEASATRENALLALGLTGREAAAEPLRRALVQRDPRRKAYAALGLGLLGRRDEGTRKLLLDEYKALVRRSDARSEEVAACVAVAFGELGEESIVDALAEPLKKKNCGRLKVYVCQALGRIGGARSRDWLVRALRDRDKEVMAAAVLALSDFPERRVVKLLKGIKGGHRMSRLYSLHALAWIGRELPAGDLLRKVIVADLVKVAEKPQKDKYQAMHAAMALAILGDGSLNAYFAENLTGEKRRKYRHEVHSAMALALALTGDGRANRDLRQIALKGSIEPDFRGYAAFALGILGETGVKEELKREIRDLKRRELHRSGCWAVGFLGDRRDVPWLIESLKKENAHHVRGAAAIAIGLIGGDAAVEPLVRMAREDRDRANRAFAIAALGCLVDREPLPRTARIFRNVHYRIRFPILCEVLSIL